jgi:hypothetical protein
MSARNHIFVGADRKRRRNWGVDRYPVRTLWVGVMCCLMLGIAAAGAVDVASFALCFSADGQNTLVPDTNALDITGPLTIEAWVKPEAGILTRGYSSIVSKQLSGTGYMIATNTASPEHRFKAEVAGRTAYRKSGVEKKRYCTGRRVERWLC